MRKHRALALFLAIAGGVVGIILATGIPSAVFPEIVFPRAIVLADNPGLPREQMLVAVTRPLEEAAYGIPGTRLARSTTSRGSAEIDVDFVEGTDLNAGFQLLNAAIGEVRSRMPAETEVRSRLLTTGVFPVIDLSISSQVRSLPELTDIAIYDLIPALHRIAGVYRADVVGGKYREYVVRLDPAAMLAHRLTPRAVVSGLAAANIVASPGRVMDEHRMLLTVASAEIHGEQDLMQTAVAEIDGRPVRIADIGTVVTGIIEDYIRAASERGPAVLIGISRQPSGNIETIAAQTNALINDARKRYPDVSFSISYDQSTLVSESYRSVRDAIALGLALSFIVVLVFTRSILSGAIAALIVTDCVAITALAMRAAGLTFNMMTLGGLAAGIGLFIDDAIVMIEGIHAQRAGGASPDEAAERAHARLARPLVGATLTAIVVFLPLAGLSGVTGTFFRALAITLGAGLAISLGLALYVTPALEIAVSRIRRKPKEREPLMDKIRGGFASIVARFVSVPALAAILTVGALAASCAIYRSLGTDYMPAIDEGAFILDYTTPAQSTTADTQDILAQIETILRSTPAVAAFSRRTGTQLGFFLTESNRGDISVRLKSDRSRGIDEIISDVRKRIETQLPAVRIEFTQVIQDFIGDLSGSPEPIEVKVFGAQQDQIEGTARNIATAIRNIPGLVDVFDGIVLSSPEQQMAVNQMQAKRYGISVDDVRDALQAAIEGTVATSIRTGDRMIDVRVRYPDSYHLSLDELSKISIQSPANGPIPLSTLVDQSFGGESPELARERLSPVVKVTARLEGIDLGSAVAAVQREIAKIQLPAGIHIEMGGLYAEQQSAFRGLAIVMIMGLLAVFAVLLWEFGNVAAAIAILLASMACLAGAFAGLYAANLTLNISSMMGLIMVAGIAAKNGILLFDEIEQGDAAGASLVDSVSNAVRVRIRPILMTALATIAGMMPLALGAGSGAQIQQPLAIAVIGGLAVSILLSTPLTAGLYALLSWRIPLQLK